MTTLSNLGLALAAALALAGCEAVDCVRNSDCPSGYYCNEVLTCSLKPTDDAGADGGTSSDLAPAGDLSTGDLATDDGPDLAQPDLSDPSDLSPEGDVDFLF